MRNPETDFQASKKMYKYSSLFNIFSRKEAGSKETKETFENLSEDQWLIAGLGNPGVKHEKTWHNMGFMALEYLAQKNNISIKKIKFKGIYGQGEISGCKVILLKPTTYMNSSGESVREAASFYKIPPENILLVYDDIDLNVGNIRIRRQGSAGTHNGMRSVISHMNTDLFPRIRIGIGPLPENRQIIDYVLSEISDSQKESVFESIKNSVDAIEKMLSDGVSKSMNMFNKNKKAKE